MWAPLPSPPARAATPPNCGSSRPAGRRRSRAGPARDERIASQAPGRGGAETGEGRDSAIKTADKGADAILITPKEGGGAQKSQGLKGLGGYGALGSPGGAVPDRRGGQVDLGPLTFDTEWYDWGPYAAEMLRRIRYHWEIPEIAQMGVPGVVRIHFFIERDGR